MKKRKEKVKAGRFILSISNGMIRMFFNICFYILICVIAVQFSRYAYDFCYQVFGSVAVDKDADAKEVEIYIESGDSTREIAKKLERDGVIKDDLSFYAKVKLNKSVIMPGTYLVKTNMDYAQILEVITHLSNAEDTDE